MTEWVQMQVLGNINLGHRNNYSDVTVLCFQESAWPLNKDNHDVDMMVRSLIRLLARSLVDGWSTCGLSS